MIAPGTLIVDRYEIVRLIGEGGMGEVYEAKHVLIGKRVALKILNAEFAAYGDALDRFHQEARISGTLGHINICEVLDYGISEDKQPFIVMEYLEGESLASLLKRDGRLPPERALRILSQVLSALKEAHGREIVHRDLKPENIFLAQVRGHGEIAKVIDFGISKVLSQDQEALRLTPTGAMIGTPFYMAPEQARCLKSVDHRSDVWAMGVILYEMLCGRVPYGGSSFAEIILRIVEDPFPEPSGEEEIDERALAVARRAMSRNPDERPQSAAEMLHLAQDALESIRGPSLSDPHPTTSTKMSVEVASTGPGSPSGRRWPRVLLLVAVAAILLVGAGVVVVVGRSRGDEVKGQAAGAARAAADGGSSGEAVVGATVAPAVPDASTDPASAPDAPAVVDAPTLETGAETPTPGKPAVVEPPALEAPDEPPAVKPPPAKKKPSVGKKPPDKTAPILEPPVKKKKPEHDWEYPG